MWDQVQQALNQSMVQLLSHVASLLPGIVALIVAFLLSVVLAGLLSVILRRFLVSVRFDERLIHWGMSSMAEWSPANSPTLLVTRIVAGSIIIVGLLIGLAAFDAALISELVLRLFAYLPRILTAVIVLVVGSVIARFLARSVLIGGVNMNLQYARLVSVELTRNEQQQSHTRTFCFKSPLKIGQTRKRVEGEAIVRRPEMLCHIRPC